VKMDVVLTHLTALEKRHAAVLAALEALEAEMREADRQGLAGSNVSLNAGYWADRLAAVRAVSEGDAEIALREASQALDELVAADSTKSLAHRIRDEFADVKMVVH